MKGIYIYYSNINREKADGIDKKVLAQLQVFKEAGLECELVVFPYIHSVKNKILGRLPFTNVDPKWQYDNRFKDIDFLYFRRPYYMSWGLRKFLKDVKKNNPNIKVILEIPTYPYEQELSANILNTPLLIRDRYNRKRLKGLVDKLPIIGEVEDKNRLWDIPIIPFINGVNVKAITPKKDEHIDGEINIICVSTCEFWHGYDRLFEGLKNYYQQKDVNYKIIIHIVGDGSERQKYEKNVHDNGLSEYVQFHGMLYGSNLNQMYDKCDLACASLGLHRIGIKVGSFLKTREYLAKGMPMLLGCKVDVISDNYKYHKEFPADDSPIDFNQIVEFYDNVYQCGESREDVTNHIRTFAENNVDMQVTMRPITDYIIGREKP